MGMKPPAPDPATATAALGSRAGVVVSLPGIGVGHGVVFHVGQLVDGRYRVEALLGRGGMGEVYRVHDVVLDQEVALKTVRAGWGDAQRGAALLRRELLLARGITHPGVCHIHDRGTHGRGAEAIEFFTMELLHGETLAERLGRCGPMTTDQAGPLVAQLCEALAAAHGHGVVHRDFKSQNILLARAPDGRERPVVTDFGVALAGAPAVEDAPDAPVLATSTMAHAGTAAYMAPEQVLGEPVGRAADLYALGVVLFETLTGRLPFAGDTPLAMARARLEAPAPRLSALRPGIDARWDAVVAACLERAPAARPGSAAAVARSLRLAPRPRRWRLAIATLLVAALATASALAALRPGGAAAPPFARLAPGRAVSMALHVGGAGDEMSQALARAGDGTLYFGGHATGTLPLGERRLTGNPDTRFGLLAALGRDGTLDWARTLSSTCDTRVVDVATLPGDDVIAVGVFCDRLLADGAAVLERPGRECFVGRFGRTDGRLRWMRSCNTSGNSHGRRVVVDAAGNSYVVANFSGEAGGDGDALVEVPEAPWSSASGPSVLSFTAEGEPRWRSAGTSTGSAGVIEPQLHGDTLYAAGSFSGELAWGGVELSARQGPASGHDGLLVALDTSTGALRWAEAVGGPGRDGLKAVRVTDGGQLVAAGEFGGGELRGGVWHPVEGEVDLWVLGFDPVRRVVDWQVAVPGTGFDSLAAFQRLPGGDLLLAGRFFGRMSLGARVLEAEALAPHAYLLRLGPRGQVVSGRTFGGAGFQIVRELLVEDDGRVTLAGKFSARIRFDDLELMSRGQNDGFVVTLTP